MYGSDLVLARVVVHNDSKFLIPLIISAYMYLLVHIDTTVRVSPAPGEAPNKILTYVLIFST